MNISSKVTERDLCISCGGCGQVCPHQAISMKYSDGSFKPLIDKENCTDCGLCTAICPSYHYDLSKYSKKDIFVGEYSDCYSAFSKDLELRKNSSSGGLVTNLILSLLKSGYYKKAAVVNYDSFNNQAVHTVTNDLDIIFDSAKSKYIPVSTQGVIDYLKNYNGEPFIVVATPCQIYTIKQYCKLKRINNPDILFLGLFCEHTLNYNVYDYYKYMYSDYDQLFFRSKFKNEWPGHTVLIKDDKHLIVDRNVRMSIKSIFKNNRCRHCFDKLNIQADISFGDHYVKGEGKSEGISSMIVRTEKGQKALESVKDQFYLAPCSFEAIAQSQGVNKLEIDYARAMTLHKDMYINAPFQSTYQLDHEQELADYAKLRMGAMAKSKEDYKKIAKIATHKSIWLRCRGLARRILVKLKILNR